MSRVYYGQSGYEGCSRSTRAAEAEEHGRLPLTRAIPVVAARAGVTQKAARAALVKTHDGEWHHTGNHARRTNYYSVEAAVRLLDPVFAKQCEDEEREERIEAFRERSIRRRDCSRYVRRHSTSANWRRLTERLAKERGLVNCWGGVLFGDATAKPGDFTALAAELDQRATQKATEKEKAAIHAEKKRREHEARRVQERRERESSVFANVSQYWPAITEPELRRQYAAKYAELRETMGSSRAYSKTEEAFQETAHAV